jgi:hypothetical protein
VLTEEADFRSGRLGMLTTSAARSNVSAPRARFSDPP